MLEGIYLLGRGRTFRHSDAGPMVRHGAEQTLVVGDVEDPVRARISRIGLSRGKQIGRASCRERV